MNIYFMIGAVFASLFLFAVWAGGIGIICHAVDDWIDQRTQRRIKSWGRRKRKNPLREARIVAQRLWAHLFTNRRT